MNIIEQIQHSFKTFLQSHFNATQSQLDRCILSLNADDQKQAFGDLTTNAAMVLAKELKQNPRQIAQTIVDAFNNQYIIASEIAGPGFINFTLSQAAFDAVAQQLYQEKGNFFAPDAKPNQAVNIEFVSANPTGPLHFGHGRGGIIGDVLGNVLSFLGYDVIKEFYINDAGAQMQKLGRSLKIRCQQQLGQQVELPEDAYHGEYLIDVAKDLIAQEGATALDKPDEFYIEFAKVKLLNAIKQTLSDYGIHHDVWFSEKSMHENGTIDTALERLQHKGHLFEEDGALWFRSTSFGDDKDRVLRKKSGELTYAAPDIAYMQNKIDRGADQLIYILGHDHHSYATRLAGMQQALGLEKYPLDVILYQLVKLKEDGQQLKMSKRSGNIVTLHDVTETVGKDVARFFYLNRKADAQLEFDLGLALTHTDENPVYYIQYAYVRTGSILANAKKEHTFENISEADLQNLTAEDDLLIKKIIGLKEVLHSIESSHETHLLAYYTLELAQAFNRYYNKNRVIDPENVPQSRARLALMHIVRTTLGLCLDLMGISKPERM